MTWQEKIKTLTTSKEIFIALRKMVGSEHPDKVKIEKALGLRWAEIYGLTDEPTEQQILEKSAHEDFIDNNPFVNGQDILK